jgi:hypothetical protein
MFIETVVDCWEEEILSGSIFVCDYDMKLLWATSFIIYNDDN